MARVSPDLRRRGSDGSGGSAKEAERDVGSGAAGRLATRLVWLLPAVVALVIAAGALFAYAGPPAAGRHVYVATQQVRLGVPVVGAGTTYDAYLARRAEDAAARELATGGLLQAGRLDAAIAAEYVAYRGYSPPGTPGVGAFPSKLAATEVGAALSATHAGNLVTVTARWNTPQGAEALLGAAVRTLVAEGVPVSTEAESGAGAPTVAIAQVAGPASGAALDGAVETAALDTLLARLGFAVAAGALTLAALWVAAARRGAGAERG